MKSVSLMSEICIPHSGIYLETTPKFNNNVTTHFYLAFFWTRLLKFSPVCSLLSLSQWLFITFQFFPLLLEMSKALRSRSWLFAPEFSSFLTMCMFCFNCSHWFHSKLLSPKPPVGVSKIWIYKIQLVLAKDKFPHSQRCRLSCLGASSLLLRSKYSPRKVFFFF